MSAEAREQTMISAWLAFAVWAACFMVEPLVAADDRKYVRAFSTAMFCCGMALFVGAR